MKKLFILIILLCGLQLTVSAQTMSFTVEGPEETYNQIRVVNETSQEEFICRVVLLSPNGESKVKDLYGVYNLRSQFDHDSNTKWIKRGAEVAIEMPKDFPVEVSFAVEYLDRPIFDIIVIHLHDADAFD